MVLPAGFANAEDDILTSFELERKNELANNGMNECRKLLGKQRTLDDYFFYEGSIQGFEESRNFKKFSDFEKRISKLYSDERAEISKSAIKDALLREQLSIYDKNAKTNDDEVWRLKGIRTQIVFVYDKLTLYRGLRQGIRIENMAAVYS